MMKTVLFCITLVFITILLFCQDAGMALQFDGDNDKVMTPVDINPAVVPNLTMSAWVYPTDYGGGGHGGHANRRQVVTHDNGGYDRALLIENNNWGVFTGGNCWNATSVDLNTWQHIAVVYSTTNIKFYKNGVEYVFGSAGTCGHSDNLLWIGDNPDFDEDFPGTIDGGSFISDAAYAKDRVWQYMYGTLNLSSGLFEITHNSIWLQSSFNDNITGGIIRTGHSFNAYEPNVFQPTGGQVEFTGTCGFPFIICDYSNNNYFHDFIFNSSAEIYLCQILPSLTTWRFCLVN